MKPSTFLAGALFASLLGAWIWGHSEYGAVHRAEQIAEAEVKKLRKLWSPVEAHKREKRKTNECEGALRGGSRRMALSVMPQ